MGDWLPERFRQFQSAAVYDLVKKPHLCLFCCCSSQTTVRMAVQHCQAAFCSGQSQMLCRDDENLSDRMSVRKISSALLPQSCIFKMTNINIFIYFFFIFCTCRKAGDLWPACVWCKVVVRLPWTSVTGRGGWKGCHLLDFSRHDVAYRLHWTKDQALLLKKTWIFSLRWASLRLTQAEKTLVMTFSNAVSLNPDALNFEFGVIAKFQTNRASQLCSFE